MTPQPTYSPRNLHPLSTQRTELVWEGKYDEYGQRWEMDGVGCGVSIEAVYDRLGITPLQLREFCQKWQIAELAVFGSILRDDFRWDSENPSDVDFLYLFSEGSQYSLFDVMHLKEELEGMLNRKVDFVSKTAIQKSRNWLRRREILGSGIMIYAKK